jgi:hypothetical protein
MRFIRHIVQSSSKVTVNETTKTQDITSSQTQEGSETASQRLATQCGCARKWVTPVYTSCMGGHDRYRQHSTAYNDERPPFVDPYTLRTPTAAPTHVDTTRRHFPASTNRSAPTTVCIVCGRLTTYAIVVVRSALQCSVQIANPITSRARYAAKRFSLSQSCTFHNQIRWKCRFIGSHQHTHR